MITRGSKFFFAGAIVAFLAALFYGFLTGASDQSGPIDVFSDGNIVNSIVGPLTFGWKGWVGDHVGYTILMGFAAVMAGLGGFATAFRDGSVEAVAQITPSGDAGPVNVPVGLSYWPVLAAFSAVIMVVGLAVNSAFFVVGVVLAVVAGFSWTVRTWAERATVDRASNVELRHTLLDPLEIPILAVVATAVIALCISQILLAIPVAAATYVIIVLAVVVFVAALVLANRPQLKRSVLVGVLVLGGLLLILGGIVGGIVGSPEHSEGGATSEEHGLAPLNSTAADSAVGPVQVDTDAVATATGH